MKTSKEFKYYQPNQKDLKDEYGDCVIRALTKATGKEWLEVFKDLIPYAMEMQCIPNCRPCYEKYLADEGFTYKGISNAKGTKRPTVQSFTKEHKEGIYVLRVANHLVAVAEGYYWDTWDSGLKSLYGYGVKE